MEPFSKVLPHYVSGSSLEGRKSSEVGLLATCHGGGLHKCRWRLGVPRHSSPQLPGHSATQGVGRRQSLQQPLQGQPQEVQLLGGLLELGLSLQRGHQPMGREGVGTVAQATWRHPQQGLDQKCLVLPHCHPTRPVHSASCHCGGWWRNEETRVQRGAAGGTGGGRTSASALRSCVRRLPSSFTTFFAPSATAASMRTRCLSSSASSSGPGRWGQHSSPRPALPCLSLRLKALPGSGDPLASRLLIFIRSRATFSWLSRSICWAAARSFLPCGVMTHASTEPPRSDQGLKPSSPVGQRTNLPCQTSSGAETLPSDQTGAEVELHTPRQKLVLGLGLLQ